MLIHFHSIIYFLNFFLCSIPIIISSSQYLSILFKISSSSSSLFSLILIFLRGWESSSNSSGIDSNSSLSLLTTSCRLSSSSLDVSLWLVKLRFLLFQLTTHYLSKIHYLFFKIFYFNLVIFKYPICTSDLTSFLFSVCLGIFHFEIFFISCATSTVRSNSFLTIYISFLFNLFKFLHCG